MRSTGRGALLIRRAGFETLAAHTVNGEVPAHRRTPAETGFGDRPYGKAADRNVHDWTSFAIARASARVTHELGLIP